MEFWPKNPTNTKQAKQRGIVPTEIPSTIASHPYKMIAAAIKAPPSTTPATVPGTFNCIAPLPVVLLVIVAVAAATVEPPAVVVGWMLRV